VTEDTEPFTGFVDSALLVRDGPHGFSLKITGWILARDARTEELLITLPSGIGVYATLVERPDVAARIPQIPHAKFAGFTVSLPVSDVEEQYSLEFRARLVTGREIMSQLHIKPETHANRGRGGNDSPSRSSTFHRPSPFGGLDHREALISTLQLKLNSFLRSKASWSFMADPPISVSIIIPVSNHASLTFGCLEALRSQMVRDIEIIVVDNASADETKALIPRMRGVISLINQTNLSFAESCNQGAAIASGQFLLFLNNDAFVLPGALENMTTAMVANPNVGAVGGKLLRPDGLIQEVGAFVLPDGTTVGRCRGTSPESAHAAQLVRVDFCSAAFLMVRKDAFDQVGGFDVRFSPAYYEDVDLCIRLTRAGFPCIVEPKAEAIHIERGSSQSLSSPDELITKNKELLCYLHPDLQHLHRIGIHLAVVEGELPNLLVIDDDVPSASSGQGLGRAEKLLLELCTCKLSISFYGAQTQHPHNEIKVPEPVKLISPKPFEGEVSFFRRILPEFDAVLVSRPHHMEVLQIALRSIPQIAPTPIIIYDAEAIQSKREILKFEILHDSSLNDDEIVEVVCNEVSVARDADVIITSSTLEAMAFTDFGFAPPIVLSHSVVPSPTPATYANREHFLHIGPLLDESSPNSDGILWFITEVMPHIKNLLKNQNLALHAVGRCTVPRISELQGNSFKLLGKITELSATYNRHRVFVAPTRYSAGIPIKVIEAAARGIPCVVGPVLAAQLGWNDEEEVLVGYDASDFGAKCAALYVNEELWQEIRARALAKVTKQFSAGQFAEAVQKIIAHIR
jgi:GT2 family glycosyltransferase